MSCLTNNEIKLKFDKTLNNLAGNRFGRLTYQNQIKEKIKDDCINYVIIPDEIEDVASSFVQGLYSEISEKYGRERAIELMVIKSVNKELLEKIDYSLKVYGL